MRIWLKERWKAYIDSSDPDLQMSGSSLGIAAFVVLVLWAIFLACQYVPFLRRVTGFEGAWVSVVLAGIGGCVTVVANRHRCRGMIGALASLFDNTFYSSSLAFAAVSMKGTPAIAMAAFHGIALIMFQGQIYAFSLLLAVVISTPLLAMIAIFRPELPVAFIIVCSTLAMLTFSTVTGNRRTSSRRQAQLEKALDAANKVADESVQAALTTTLLTLGHFLHELRNYQTSISANLAYVELKSNLDDQAQQALKEAQEAQEAEQELVRSTIDDLRARSSPTRTAFLLSEALTRPTATPFGIEIVVSPMDIDLEVSGNPEHLGVVLLNLIRNAEQAGATQVRIECRAEPSGQAADLLVHDDGHGMETAKRDRLFDTFTVSAKPGGSGLGLYLVRRYVELLGGTVEAQVGPLGGAAFLIRLPGKVRHARLRDSLPSGERNCPDTGSESGRHVTKQTVAEPPAASKP